MVSKCVCYFASPAFVAINQKTKRDLLVGSCGKCIPDSARGECCWAAEVGAAAVGVDPQPPQNSGAGSPESKSFQLKADIGEQVRRIIFKVACLPLRVAPQRAGAAPAPLELPLECSEEGCSLSN